MFTKSVVLSLGLALSLAACASTSSEEAYEAEAESELDLDEVNRFGGVLVAKAISDDVLPACGRGEDLCEEGVRLGCCELDGEKVCFACAAPISENLPESECQENLDCGDGEGDRCFVEEGFGTCYQVCGGVDALECEDGETCVTPMSSFGPSAFGVCKDMSKFLESIDESLPATVADPSKAMINPLFSFDHLKKDLTKHAQPE